MKILSLKTLVTTLIIASGCLAMAAENAPAEKKVPERAKMMKRNTPNRKRSAFMMSPAIRKTAKEIAKNIIVLINTNFLCCFLINWNIS